MSIWIKSMHIEDPNIAFHNINCYGPLYLSYFWQCHGNKMASPAESQHQKLTLLKELFEYYNLPMWCISGDKMAESN